ncbi:hypothetical protein ACP70R_029612 [Stipagrostis hirtigluma subsp. patula]
MWHAQQVPRQTRGVLHFRALRLSQPPPPRPRSAPLTPCSPPAPPEMSFPTFPTHPIVSPARKKDHRKDAAAKLCSPSGEAGRAAVAVDGDRCSQYALKWAADHVLSRGRSFFLLHVRRKHTAFHSPGGKQFAISHVQDDVPASFHAQLDLQTKELLLPFQCFCSRRRLQCREIVLDGVDTSKAIVDFVVSHNIDKLVLGAASRNAFTRTIRKMDVPTSVTKSAPNFCSVYVIAKGKLSSFKPATHANVNDTSKEDCKSDIAGNRLPGAKSEPTRSRAIDASSDELTEEGSSMSASAIDQNGHYLYPEYPGQHRDILLLPDKDNEHVYHAPHRKYLDESGFNDRAHGPGYNIWEPLSPTSSGEYTAATDHHDDVEAELRQFKVDGDPLAWNYNEEQEEMARIPQSFSSKPPYINRMDGEPRSDGPKLKRLTLDLSSDTQYRERIIEEFRDHSSQEVIYPILRRLPPKFYSPRNDIKPESAPEETYRLELKSKALPRPIETKRMLECLPTRLECRTYTPDDIAKATSHFSDDLKIGEGGYGPVYKATLDNTLVAIKILHSNVTQGLKQFQQEIDLLNNMRHPNMVHLVGACPEYGCLVYEYMPNGSLEDRLFCRSGTPPLPWRLRFRIAVEIANGLLYLHKMKPEAFVHRDLKPGNILLGADFVSKIGDVGLARIIPRSMDGATMTTQYRETAAAGTFCYIDPEYQKTGLVCTKSDVYALGVIYLQMITGRDAMGLAYTVSDALEEGTFAELLDGNVTGWPVPEAQEFAELALKCCEMRRRDRPDLETVVLPELVRLHALVTSSALEDPSSHMDEVPKRSASEKDLPLEDELVDILNDGNVKRGSSFAV